MADEKESLNQLVMRKVLKEGQGINEVAKEMNIDITYIKGLLAWVHSVVSPGSEDNSNNASQRASKQPAAGKKEANRLPSSKTNYKRKAQKRKRNIHATEKVIKTPLTREEQDKIVREVLVDGKTYQEVGDKYDRSRERIRQIIFKLNPQLVGKRIRSSKQRYCMRCGERKITREADPANKERFFENEEHFCRKCRNYLHQQPVFMQCECCGMKSVLTVSRVIKLIRNAKRRKGKSFIKLSEDKSSGTYICRPCYYKLMTPLKVFVRKNITPLINLVCEGCGKSRKVRIAEILGKPYTINQHDKVASYWCAKCFQERLHQEGLRRGSKKSLKKHALRVQSNLSYDNKQ